MNSGYIKLYRKFLNWEWFDDNATFRLFICLLFHVNWEEKKWRGETIKRGEILTSLNHMAEFSNLSVKQVRRALDNLKSTGEITVTGTNRYTKIKINNYKKYQLEGTQRARQNTDNNSDKEKIENEKGKQRANKGQTKGKQRANKGQQLKNNKNIKNYKNIYSQIQNAYNERCQTLPKCTKLTDQRKKLIDARLKDYEFDDFIQVFDLASASDFLSGRSGKWNGCNFDWLLKPNNFIKVIEGTYNNTKRGKKMMSRDYDFDELQKSLLGG